MHITDTANTATPQDEAARLDELAIRLCAEGRALLDAGRAQDAIVPLRRATVVRPLVPEIYQLMAEAMQTASHAVAPEQAGGYAADAMAARIAAEAFKHRSVADIIGIGASYARHKKWDAAGYWFQRALLLNPDVAETHLHMGMALRELGREAESEACSRNACLRQSLYPDQVWPMQRRSILVLCTGGNDNVPLQFLMPTPINRQIRWAVEFGIVGPLRELPPYDLVFNAIGDADRAPAGLAAAARFVPQAGKPVLNPPDRIMRTSRDQIPGLLADLEGVYMPVTVRWNPGAGVDLAATIAAAGLQYPLTARPVGKHGGKGLRRLDTEQEAQEAGRGEKDEMYLSRYCDYRSADGYFRKYRVVFVDREPLPYHLAIGEQWVLHYVTADMRPHAWKTEEERRFLDDPQSALGPAAWAALREIGRRLDLDYCGVDFSLLPDGRVLVFEANATMLVHPENGDDEALRFKNPYVQRIFDAFENMLVRRMPAIRNKDDESRVLENTQAVPDSSRNAATAALIDQGRKLLEAGQLDQAMDALEQAATADPLNPEIYRVYAQALRAAGMPVNAEAARLGGEALERRSATDLCGLGHALLQRGDWGMAGYWYKRAMLLDPTLIQAYLGMGKAMLELGRGEEAERYAHQAHQLQSLFVDADLPTQRRSVLILCGSGLGDVPVKSLIPNEHNRQIRWAIEYGITGPFRKLPPYDLIFNAIGDADRAPAGLAAAARFAPQAGKPVLNPPDRIMRTSRDQIAALLSGIEGVYMPPTARWDSRSGTSLAAAIEAAGLAYPATLRPVGGHGGKGLVRIETAQDADAAGRQAGQGEHYLSRYCDYRSADGYYRKYRVIFVDREPWPYHLAVGEQWILHYVTADMRPHAWKTEEERRFLDDPQSALGPAAWAALREIGKRLDLDYCGVDFSLLPDGRVLVFEANATMLVHPEKPDDPVLGFKNPYVQRIYDAFERMLARRMPEQRVP